MSYKSRSNPESLTRNRFQTKIKEIKNKLNEADYSEKDKLIFQQILSVLPPLEVAISPLKIFINTFYLNMLGHGT